MATLHRFWIKFSDAPLVVRSGCGVTALTYEDALSILEEKLFVEYGKLGVASVTADVAVSSLDAGHVLPNMGVVSIRGIWYPLGFQDLMARRKSVDG